MTSANLTYNLTSSDILEARFGFVSRVELRKNLANTLSLVIFLLSLNQNKEIPGFLKAQLNKNIIINSVTILEAVTTWKLLDMLDSNQKSKADYQSKKAEYEYQPFIKIFAPTPSGEIWACYQLKQEVELKRNTNFIEVNRIAQNCGLFDKKMFAQVDQLRIMRNRIHIAGLKDVDDTYAENDVNEVFKTVKTVIDRIESY